MASPRGTAQKRTLDYSDTIKFSVGRLADGAERTYYVPKSAILGRSRFVSDAFASLELVGSICVNDLPNVSNKVFNSYVHLLLTKKVVVNFESAESESADSLMALIDLYTLAADVTDCHSMNKVMDKLVDRVKETWPDAQAIKKIYGVDPDVGGTLRRLFVDSFMVDGSDMDFLEDLASDHYASQLWEFFRDLSIALIQERNSTKRKQYVAADYYVELENSTANA
ncbi:unnamed protein product [Cercospora beticola]|nr:unnamed protein product [Cercospora beticola]